MKEGVNINSNNISQILDIADKNSTITDLKVEGNVKYITLTKDIDHSLKCPICGSKLKSKGQFTRHPNNQIFQDGYIIDLTVIGRRWKCSNEDCSYSYRDSFDFLEKRKRTTKIIPFQILMALKDVDVSCVQVAKMFNVSDTYVHQVFKQYVDLPRKKLTKYICIDEVYLNLSPTCKYAIVIMDFVTGDILDIIPSRRKIYTENYFLSIPRSERNQVEYLCCDMYDPYINYTNTYFPNAKVVTDSFHVLKWLLSLINIYINTVKKRYMAKDAKRLKDKNHQTNSSNKTIEESKEVYILKKAKWVLLSNPGKFKDYESSYNHKLGMFMDSYAWEREFLKLDPKFEEIKRLKDMYEEFNESFINDLPSASRRLDELIKIYETTDIAIFNEFARLITKYHDSIVASFTYIIDNNMENDSVVIRRLFNGPLESFNNIPSSLRAHSHGIDDFDFFRNRILWHCREDAAIQAIPKSKKEIHRASKPRGPYNKKK